MRRAGVIVGLVLLLCACARERPSGPAAPAPGASPSTVYDSCLTADEATALSVTSPVGNTPLRAAMLGTSNNRAVVFSNMAGRTGCDWVPVGRKLVEKGIRVVVWSYGPAAGVEQVRELVAVVAEVRRLGITTVALAGGSRGGCLAMLTATELQPPPAGVAILSCAGVFNREQPVQTAPYAAKLTVPVLHITGANDTIPNAGEARADYAAFPAADKKLVVVPGTGAHGVALLTGTNGPTPAQDELVTFLDRVTH